MALRISIFLFYFLLTACAVQWSPDYNVYEDIVTGEEYWEISIGVTYPKTQFMSMEEYNEYMALPLHQKDMMWEAYEERAELEKEWKEFIEGILENVEEAF